LILLAKVAKQFLNPYLSYEDYFKKVGFVYLLTESQQNNLSLNKIIVPIIG